MLRPRYALFFSVMLQDFLDHLFGANCKFEVVGCSVSLMMSISFQSNSEKLAEFYGLVIVLNKESFLGHFSVFNHHECTGNHEKAVLPSN